MKTVKKGQNRIQVLNNVGPTHAKTAPDGINEHEQNHVPRSKPERHSRQLNYGRERASECVCVCVV